MMLCTGFSGALGQSLKWYTETAFGTQRHRDRHSLLSTHDVVFKSLNDEGKIRYLLTLENETTSKIVGKYTYLTF